LEATRRGREAGRVAARRLEDEHVGFANRRLAAAVDRGVDDGTDGWEGASEREPATRQQRPAVFLPGAKQPRQVQVSAMGKYSTVFAVMLSFALGK
jgi:hypothetical protein